MIKCELAALCAWGRWLVSLGPGSQPLETCPFGHAYIFSSVCMIRLTSPASLNSVYLFHIRSLSIALWRKRCDKDDVGGAVCLYNLTQYPCSLRTVWLYVWGPMCRNSSLSSLEVGMTGNGIEATFVPYKVSNQSFIFSHHLLFVFRHARPSILGFSSSHKPHALGDSWASAQSAWLCHLLVT